MNHQTKMTQQFMNFFRQEMHEKPTIPSVECRKLRAKLILEEAIETIEALGFDVVVNNNNLVVVWTNREPNLKEIFDGLCDLRYVADTGTALACGLQNIMDEGFAEVHRSNMSKSWTKEQVEEGRKQYPNAIVEYFGGNLYRFIVDGKVIKSSTYSPANLQAILAKELVDKEHLTPIVNCPACKRIPCVCHFE